MSGAVGVRWAPLLVTSAAATAVAVSGASLTQLGPWYRELRKPSWQPPDWLFGPAWTLIFVLTAVAGARAWNASPDPRERRQIVTAYTLNGGLNILWSLLFFRLKRPDWALVEVAGLWLSILGLIAVSTRRARGTGWLLLPYLSWVSFAAVLNATIVRLNRPFP